MLKDLIVALAEAAGLKAIIPRLGKLAKTALATLTLLFLFSAIGVISVFYLLYKLAVKPADSVSTRLNQIELRLNQLDNAQTR